MLMRLDPALITEAAGRMVTGEVEVEVEVLTEKDGEDIRLLRHGLNITPKSAIK